MLAALWVLHAGARALADGPAPAPALAPEPAPSLPSDRKPEAAPVAPRKPARRSKGRR